MQSFALITLLLANSASALVIQPFSPTAVSNPQFGRTPAQQSAAAVSMQFGRAPAKPVKQAAAENSSKIPGLTNLAPLKGVLLVAAFVWAVVGSAS